MKLRKRILKLSEEIFLDKHKSHMKSAGAYQDFIRQRLAEALTETEANDADQDRFAKIGKLVHKLAEGNSISIFIWGDGSAEVIRGEHVSDERNLLNALRDAKNKAEGG